ncbi:unnamed protein product [Linum trigynum]|uniref:Uncharacterized protein n=1 Tax=Linum trigynum TaxID=586398 RepID=A0AAV2D7L6_9ROSI
MATGSARTESDDGVEEFLREDVMGTETSDGELGAATMIGDGDDADGKSGREVLMAAGSGAALLTKSRSRRLN